MKAEEEPQRGGLTRERLVEAALALVEGEGLDALSMRGLADRLGVKAASLYWHVRDRRELLELLAESILDAVRRPRRVDSWRDNVLALGGALGRSVAAHKDAGRVLLEVPASWDRSDVFRAMTGELAAAGLQPSEARDVALMVMTHAIAGHGPREARVAPSRAEASVAIDTGSRGVVLRAGPRDMQTLFRVPPDQATAAPAAQRGEGAVVVRRLRGVGHGVIELNPARPWRIKVQAPTWNTLLDVGGLDVREIHVDSGAAKLECFLPRPRGVTPIHIASGVAKVSLHRPRGTALIANLSAGAVKSKLDDFSVHVTLADVHWESDGASSASDRYELTVSGGAVQVSTDTYEPTIVASERSEEPGAPVRDGASALEILLDGVEARTKRG